MDVCARVDRGRTSARGAFSKEDSRTCYPNASSNICIDFLVLVCMCVLCVCKVCCVYCVCVSVFMCSPVFVVNTMCFIFNVLQFFHRFELIVVVVIAFGWCFSIRFSSTLLESNGAPFGLWYKRFPRLCASRLRFSPMPLSPHSSILSRERVCFFFHHHHSMHEFYCSFRNTSERNIYFIFMQIFRLLLAGYIHTFSTRLVSVARTFWALRFVYIPYRSLPLPAVNDGERMVMARRIVVVFVSPKCLITISQRDDSAFVHGRNSALDECIHHTFHPENKGKPDKNETKTKLRVHVMNWPLVCARSPIEVVCM